MSADNYKVNSTVIAESLEDFIANIEGTTDFYHRVLRLSNSLNNWSETKSKALSKKLGVSHWSQNARLIVFVTIVIGFPTVLITYGVLYVFAFAYHLVKNRVDH